MVEVTRGRSLRAGAQIEARPGYFMPFTVTRVEKVYRDDRGKYYVQTAGGDVVPEGKVRRVRW